ncbi:MAG: undecaprenyl-diphosphate phosphatase [Methanococcoides sp.]|nr:undecaprenyl-diphosphate phosphatase [Methanococcoides sp.]
MLSFSEAIILGIVQGLAEWLPISSEGMTSLVMVTFFDRSLSEAIPISIWLHLGTLLAATVYFRDDVKKLLSGIPDYVRSVSKKEPHDPIISFLLISTALTGIVGLPLLLFVTDNVEISGGSATAVIGIMLIFTGLLQRTISKDVSLSRVPGMSDSLVSGVAQGFAAIPGISRSGITMSALLLRKFDAADAIRLSFLMSIPAVLVAEIGIGLMDMVELDVYSFVALFFAFVFGLVTIDLFLKVAKKVDFSYFCIGLGILSVLAMFL